MKYFLHSIATYAFWRHAVFSKDGFIAFLAAMGSLFTFLEFLDFFGIYTRGNYSHYAILPIVFISLAFVVLSRRPLKRFCYKVPGRDIRIEVKVGDLFSESADTVISTNSSFDTDLSDGLISAQSLQGQLAINIFRGNTAEIDRQLDLDLLKVASTDRVKKGKQREYPIGTVARVKVPEKTFYFVAMAHLNEHLTSVSSVRIVEDALLGLWRFVKDQGELKPIAISVMGTGRGRVEVPRKKMVERIAQSFADASSDRIFCNRLIITIRPDDAQHFSVNLFEIRDYLERSLHI